MSSPIFKSSSSTQSVSTSPAKKLALPRPGKSPTFDDLTNLVWISTLWEMPVGILCLTQESLDLWTGWLERFPAGLPALDVLDINQATLEDWQAFLRRQSYDITLLHGAYAELQTNRLSVLGLGGPGRVLRSQPDHDQSPLYQGGSSGQCVQRSEEVGVGGIAASGVQLPPDKQTTKVRSL